MKINYKMKIIFAALALFLIFIIGKGIKFTSAQIPQMPTEQPKQLVSALSEQSKTPPVVSIDEFEYKDSLDFKNTWIVIASNSAKVDLTASSEVFTDLGFESSKSLKIESNVPLVNPRYEQIMYIFPAAQDWTVYGDFIEIWVKGDDIEQEPWGGEFSICLIDSGSKEDEIWQSTRWIDRKGAWKKITISLTGNGQGNPWQHAEDFVIPEWEKVQNGVLDKNKIKGVMIKSLTTEESAGKYPSLAIYVDHLVRY